MSSRSKHNIPAGSGVAAGLRSRVRAPARPVSPPGPRSGCEIGIISSLTLSLSLPPGVFPFPALPAAPRGWGFVILAFRGVIFERFPLMFRVSRCGGRGEAAASLRV